MDARPSPPSGARRDAAALVIPSKIAEWLRLFAELEADPLMLVGVKPDGTPVIAAVETIRGERFELRQLLTDVLLRVGDR